MNLHHVISLMTDFGYEDPYVGIMKGVIFTINPLANVIDLCHGIDSFDIKRAGFILRYSYPYFPKRTVHLVVVDPTVGSKRRPLVASIDDHFFVCPDNGILSQVMYGQERITVYHFDQEHFYLPNKSTTFHGRDVFAPAAAWLSKTIDPTMLGTEINDYLVLPVDLPVLEGGVLKGRICHIDKFGNLITNFDEARVTKLFPRSQFDNLVIRCGNVVVRGIKQSYHQVPNGPMALFGGTGYLELALALQSAHTVLGIGLGTTVELSLERS